MSEPLLEPAPPAGPRCAEHPLVAARQKPCERCGNFACEDCFADPTSEVCKSCRERTGLGGTIPWEIPDRGAFDRLTATLQLALPEPRSTFRAIGSGLVTPSLTFFLATLAMGYAPLLLCLPIVGLGLGAYMSAIPEMPSEMGGGMMVGLLCGMIGIFPIYMLIVHGLTALFYAVVFHGAAVLLGGRGSFGASLRGVLYTGAIMPITAIGFVLGWIPIIGSIVQLVIVFTKLLWSGFALAGTAESVHGLKDERALLAGHLPGALAVLLFIGLFALGMGMMLMTSRM